MSASEPKPIASLSVDLDNQWSYMKTHGDPGWEAFPSYLDIVVPRILKFFEDLDLKITFFIVGQDAALRKNRDALASIAEAGHEIGNHSFHHNPWLHLYTEQDFEAEIERAEVAIEGATGQRPVGFRGPGYSLSDATLRVLARRGYLYDASALPTFLGPFARAYYFRTAKLTADERLQRKALFGKFSDGFRPNRPFQMVFDGEPEAASITEIPVTTMPVLRIPFHVSYLLYLASISLRLALSYFKFALALCRLIGVQPSLLLHPLDFLGSDDAEGLSFFPGMALTTEEKAAVVSQAMGTLRRRHEIVELRQHALEFQRAAISTIAQPEFGSGQHRGTRRGAESESPLR
jgi:hypothetical protein